VAQRTILVADDDASIRSLLKQLLSDEGYSVVEATTGTEVVEKVKDTNPDLVIMDVRMPELDGIEALSKLKVSSPKTSVLIMTAFGSSNNAIRAMELGAFDYITKPFELDKISHTVRRVIEYRDLTSEVQVLRDEISSLVQTERIVGNSPAMQEVYKTVGKVAKADATVLITGESGTGKELVAEALHYNSNRRSGPIVKVSCAALPETLLEAERFGHEKGSFTGAAERRLGRFELADAGTILLDEIGEMPASTQVKLLRVLEDKSFFRVGGTQPIKVDVRVIAATNKSVKEAVALGRFRDDLFYRLNVLSVYLTPLRERRSDIPLLVRTFVAEFAKTHARTFRGITPEAMQILVEADWPGNVRQLKNLIESMVVLAPEGEIRASDIPRDIRERTRTMPVRIAEAQGVPREITGQELEFIFRTLVEMKVQLEELRRRIEERAPERVEVIEVGGSREQGAGSRRLEPATVDPLDSTPEPDGPVVYKAGMTMSDVERAAIDAALRETRGNRRKAAEVLGIGERTLYRKLKEYAIS